VLIIILLGAAVLAGAIGNLKDAGVIAVVVLLNASLGFLQEHRAEAALAALRKMLAPSARVRRDGEVQQIEAAALVPATCCCSRPATAFRRMRGCCRPTAPRWPRPPSPANPMPWPSSPTPWPSTRCWPSATAWCS
jgi:hypothetical protein